MSAADRAAFMRMMGITDDDLADPNGTTTAAITAGEKNTKEEQSNASNANHTMLHKPISAHATLSSASSSAGLSSAAMTHTTSSTLLSSPSATLTRTTSMSLPPSAMQPPFSPSCTPFTNPSTNHNGALGAFSEPRSSPACDELTPASATHVLLSSVSQAQLPLAARHEISSPELTQSSYIMHNTSHSPSSSSSPHTSHLTRGTLGNKNSISNAEELKAAGNAAFTRGAFVEAITYYSHAIDALRQVQSHAAANPTSGLTTMSNEGDVGTELLAALYGNRSASYLQAARALDSIEVAYEHALYDAEAAVRLRPSWCKGYARQGDVFFKMLQYSKAADAYAMALRLEPSNANVERAYDESRTRASAASREEIARRRARRSRPRMSSTCRLPASSSLPSAAMHANTPVTRTLSLQTPNTTATIAHNTTTTSSREYDDDALYAGQESHGHTYAHTLASTVSSLPGPQSGDAPLPPTRPVQPQSERTALAAAVPQQAALRVSTPCERASAQDETMLSSHKEAAEEEEKEENKNTPAKAMWRELKAELATLSHEPTGDDYRRQQLERFRKQQQQQQQQGQRAQSRSFSQSSRSISNTPATSTTTTNYNNDDSTQETHATSHASQHQDSSTAAATNAAVGKIDTLSCDEEADAEEEPKQNWAEGRSSSHTTNTIRRTMLTTKPRSAEPYRSSVNYAASGASSTAASMSSAGLTNNTTSSSSSGNNNTSHDGLRTMNYNSSNSKEGAGNTLVQSSASSVPSSRASSSGPGQRMRFMSIPEQFSSSAATAYQQRLLEEFRKKKAMHK